MSDSVLLALSAAYRENPSDENAHRLAAHVSRLEAPTTRKVLISPGYGAGFSTWLPQEFRQLAAEFAPLIEAVESDSDIRPALAQLREIVGDQYALENPENLRVVEVAGPYRIEDFDGYEVVRTLADLS